MGLSLAASGRDCDGATEENSFIAEAVNTLMPVAVPAEQLGTQVVGLVQEAVLGALEPGLGVGTQVPQVVIIVGLHKALEGPGAPVDITVETPATPRDFCPVDPFLPLTQESLLSPLTLYPSGTQGSQPCPRPVLLPGNPRVPALPLLPQTQARSPVLRTRTRTTANSLLSWSPATPSTPSPCPEPASRNYWPTLAGGSRFPQALLADMLDGIRGQLGTAGTPEPFHLPFPPCSPSPWLLVAPCLSSPSMSL